MTSKRRASFKFQSDSINTCTVIRTPYFFIPLNSNLILLILMSAALTNNNATCFKFQSDSINTNLTVKEWKVK